MPETLPVLPLKNTVIFPHLLAPLLVNTERSKKLIEAVMAGPERLILAVAVRSPVEESPRFLPGTEPRQAWEPRWARILARPWAQQRPFYTPRGREPMPEHFSDWSTIEQAWANESED